MSTIKDIARETGVGVGTVSRFLNGITLKPATEARVKAAIAQLGYTRNPVAQGLRTRKTRTVGVVIPNFADIYGSTMVRFLEKGLSDAGYGILVCDSDNSPAIEREKVRLLLQRKVDALFLYPCKSDVSYLNAFRELGSAEQRIPVVVGDMRARGFPFDEEGGRMAATLLIRRMKGDWSKFPYLSEQEATLICKGATRRLPPYQS